MSSIDVLVPRQVTMRVVLALLTMCVLGSSAVRSKRYLFGENSFCRSRPPSNIVVLSADSPRVERYNGEVIRPSRSLQDVDPVHRVARSVEEDPWVQRTSPDPEEQVSRSARSVKDSYERDSRFSRGSKRRWSSRSARDGDFEDEEDDEGYENKPLSSLPKGRYLLIPTSSDLEDILKSKDPQLNENNYFSSKGKQVKKESDSFISRESIPQNYEESHFDYQNDYTMVQQTPTERNCPHCNTMPQTQKTMHKQPMDPKYFQDMLQTDPSFLKRFLESHQVRPRRFSNVDQRVKTITPTFTEAATGMNTKSTPISESKVYNSPRNVVGKIQKPLLPQTPSKRSPVFIPKHILEMIQSQVPESRQPEKNSQTNLKTKPQTVQQNQNQNSPTNHNMKRIGSTQQNIPPGRQTPQTPQQFPSAPSMSPNNRLFSPNQEVPVPAPASSEHSMSRRHEETRRPPTPQRTSADSPNSETSPRNINAPQIASNGEPTPSLTPPHLDEMQRQAEAPPVTSGDPVPVPGHPQAAPVPSNSSKTPKPSESSPTDSASVRGNAGPGPAKAPIVKVVDFSRQDSSDALENIRQM